MTAVSATDRMIVTCIVLSFESHQCNDQIGESIFFYIGVIIVIDGSE
jgi:hypothetical protein